jgi:erythromycin esterase
MEVSRAEEQAISNWLRDNALPIRYLEAGNGFEDLRPLQQILRDVEVVGLGEATHGTREFVQLKHRLFEFLVIEMGFTVFALEASSAACQPLNDYIVSGVGDLEVALTDQHYVVWDIEEMAALVEWLRRHNSDIPDARKVNLHGVDFSYNENGRKAVLGYLSRVAPERVDRVAALYRALAEEEAKWPVRIDTESQAAIRQLLPKVRALADDLSTSRAQFIGKSSAAEHDRIQQHVKRMEQWCSLDGPGRSRHMADNLISVLDRDEPSAKAIIWQHNAHINVQTPRTGNRRWDRPCAKSTGLRTTVSPWNSTRAPT